MKVNEKIEAVTGGKEVEFKHEGKTFTAAPIQNDKYLREVQAMNDQYLVTKNLIYHSLKNGEGDFDKDMLDNVSLGFLTKAMEAAAEANDIEKNQLGSEDMEIK